MWKCRYFDEIKKEFCKEIAYKMNIDLGYSVCETHDPGGQSIRLDVIQGKPFLVHNVNNLKFIPDKTMEENFELYQFPVKTESKSEDKEGD